MLLQAKMSFLATPLWSLVFCAFPTPFADPQGQSSFYCTLQCNEPGLGSLRWVFAPFCCSSWPRQCHKLGSGWRMQWGSWCFPMMFSSKLKIHWTKAVFTALCKATNQGLVRCAVFLQHLAVPIGHGKAANYAPVDKRNWNWDVFLKILHTWLWWACHQLLLFHCADVCLSCNFTALRQDWIQNQKQSSYLIIIYSWILIFM